MRPRSVLRPGDDSLGMGKRTSVSWPLRVNLNVKLTVSVTAPARTFLELEMASLHDDVDQRTG